jgi:hypothetical protein
MARSKDVLVEEIKDQDYNQFAAVYDSLTAYRNDRELFKSEVLTKGTALRARLGRMGGLISASESHATDLANATVSQVAAILDALVNIPAEPDPTNPPVDPTEPLV